MARMITVEESRFDELFQQTFDKLKLTQFSDSGAQRSQEEFFKTQDMWRMFHYEVCQLKDKLKKG